MADTPISTASAESVLLLLRAQKNAYEEMIALSEALRDSVIRCDAETAGGIVAKQREKLTRIQTLEGRREAAISRIAEESGVPAQQLTLSYISRHVGEGLSARIDAMGRELLAVVNKQRGMNEQNRALMELSMDIMHTVVAAMAETNQLNNTYSGNGADGPENARSNLFIRDV